MKAFSHIAAVMAVILLVASAGFAQKQMTRDERVKEIVKLSNSKKSEDKEKGYSLAKDFIAEFGKEAREDVQKITGWVINYSKAKLDERAEKGDAIGAFAVGEYLLTLEPENVNVFMNLALAGFDNLQKTKDASFNDDIIKYSEKALSILNAPPAAPTNQVLAMLNTQSKPAMMNPFNSKDEALANLHYFQGYIFLGSDLRRAAQNFRSSINYDSKIKSSAFPYAVIGSYYENAYSKRVKDFKAKTGLTKAQEDEEVKAINLLLANLVDSYARAVKVAEAENNPGLSEWRELYATFYKFWKKSDTGSDKFLGAAMSTPMPEIP